MNTRIVATKNIKECGVVYGLVCPVTNNIVYIGQTIRPLKNRISGHRGTVAKRKSYTAPIQKWLFMMKRKRLLHSIRIEPIIDNVPIDNLRDVESHIIYTYGKVLPLLNATLIGVPNYASYKEIMKWY